MTKEELKIKLKTLVVLFVDDEEFVVKTMKEIFPMLFKNCYFANNGIEGVDLYKNNKIDIVITDLSMPKMNGIEMLKNIQKINKNFKSICVSGHNEKNYLEDAHFLGSAYIVKPINSAELYKALSSLY